ncbi:DUF2274 domain-containing protein [Phenylobacterium sp.]|uniref:DUF2274 domain-containing protein n=1 Tax=Phenylobacterium sp. TaxID=1871053 RepID=UPI00289CD255|nr:DUF2274 domain-containing protein [Phenylobacterium sp.]
MAETLKLAGLLDDTPVKLAIELPAAVHRDLVAYCDAMAREGGRAIEPAKLAPVMLSRFMATDRAFARLKRGR